MVPMPKNLNSLPKEEVQKFLASFDTVLTDCDGVLWLNNEVIKNSENTVNKFKEMNKALFYVTNNNSLTREEYVAKCTKLGFKATVDNIICTSYLAGEYLKSINFKKRVYVIGRSGIVRELDKVGIRHTGIGPDVIDTDLEDYVVKKMCLDTDIGAVIIGFDEHFSYPKILKAASYLKNPDCHFIATCSDETFPVPESENLVFGGTGCFVRCLEAVTGRRAFILGKPSDYIKSAILKTHKIDPGRTLMIGDRCNTDILFGNKCGFQTLLVLTGCTSLKDVETYANSSDPKENALVPQFYVNKLGDILPFME